MSFLSIKYSVHCAWWYTNINSCHILFNIFISDQPNSNQTLVGDFADNKAIIATSTNSYLASLYVQNHLNLLETWYRNWGVKINENKSIHCTPTLLQGICQQLSLNNQLLPIAQCVRYIGIHIDRCLTCLPYIKTKFNHQIITYTSSVFY